jgi:hypothetical protein
MISHPYMGMNSDVVSLACITQPIQAEPISVFFEEAGFLWLPRWTTWLGRPGRYILGFLGIGISFSGINIVFLSLYDIFIIVRESPVPPTPLTRPTCTDFKTVLPRGVVSVITSLNTRPRKKLNYKIAAERMAEHVVALAA